MVCYGGAVLWTRGLDGGGSGAGTDLVVEGITNLGNLVFAVNSDLSALTCIITFFKLLFIYLFLEMSPISY